MTHFTLYRAVTLLAFFFICAGLSAQVRPLISVQGTLKDINGVTVADGERAFTFRLYNVESGGTMLWEEVAPVDVSGGIYSHNLGSVTLLDESLFASTVFLGITVDGNELSPRTTLTYAPYALSVAAAQRVAKGGCSGQVGDVKYSILNPEQFAGQNGDCWVAMDGQSMAGSTLAGILNLQSVPDMSGAFIRAQEFTGGVNRDDNRDVNSPIATYQGDTFKSHLHAINNGGNHSHQYQDSWLSWVQHRNDGTSFDFKNIPRSGVGGKISSQRANNVGLNFNNNLGTYTTAAGGNHNHTMQNAGAVETRPENLNLYVYIRIN